MSLFKIRKEEKAEEGRPKEVRQILDEQIDTSLKEFNRSGTGLFISAFSAGLEVGFSMLLMATVYTYFSGELSPSSLHLAIALSYPLGFIFVIIGRSELFTEHTALAILPVMNGSVKITELFQLWGLIYVGNLLGGYLFSFIVTRIGPDIGFATNESFEFLAHEMIDYPWSTIFYSAILAGWMMGLLGWLVTSSQETISRIFIVILVTSVIGIAGLHHSIVGSIEVFSGLITSDKITFTDYSVFQIWSTLGNLVGGAVFVAVLKFSHVRAGGR